VVDQGIPERPGEGFGAKYKNRGQLQVKAPPPKKLKFVEKYKLFGC